MDLLIPLSNKSTWSDNELRYALRSVESNLQGIDTVWTIGHKPEWLINTTHILLGEATKTNSDANIIAKVEYLCKQPGLSDNFIRMSDDQLVLKFLKASEIPIYHVGKGKSGSTTWYKRLQNTLKALDHLDPRNYDSHYPMIYNKKDFIKSIKGFKYWTNPGYTINSLYFNQVLVERKRLPIGYRTHIRKPLSIKEIEAISQDSYFLCYNDSGLNESMKMLIECIFPNPSGFEK